jgi:hypothetical protein
MIRKRFRAIRAMPISKTRLFIPIYLQIDLKILVGLKNLKYFHITQLDSITTVLYFFEAIDIQKSLHLY